MNLRDVGWKLAIAAVVIAGAVAFVHVITDDDAEVQVARADSLESELEDAGQRLDSIRQWTDSMERANERIQQRERRILDSLQTELAHERRKTAAADTAAQHAMTEVDRAIIAAVGIVDEPREREAIRGIARADSARRSNVERLVTGLRRQVQLQSERALSFERSRDSLLVTLDAVRTERDTLRSALEGARGVIDAKNSAIRELQRDPWDRLFGRTLVETAGNVGSGTMAYAAGGREGLLGWGIAKGVDVLIGVIEDDGS